VTAAVTVAQSGSPSVSLGFKNRIINGGMTIDQRNAGASVTPASFSYTLDRWEAVQTSASKFSVQQNAGSVTPPNGFTKYLGVTSLSAYSVGAGDTFNILQSIEGYNCADLAWGTSAAKSVTLSFQVYSSLTGTFGAAIKDGSSTYSYPFTYTISSANTWTQVSVTIPAPTAGQFAYTSTTNGVGIQVCFGLGGGSTYSGTAGSWNSSNSYTATGATSVVGTNGATWYITGVQLEKGTAATQFEFRDYGRELIMCQRYYEKMTFAAGDSVSTAIANGSSGNTQIIGVFNLQVKKRASATSGSSAGGTFKFGWLGNAVTANSILVNGGTTTTGTLAIGLPSGAGQIAGYIAAETSAAYVDFSAEL
jgi:hypothetical protein